MEVSNGILVVLFNIYYYFLTGSERECSLGELLGWESYWGWEIELLGVRDRVTGVERVTGGELLYPTGSGEGEVCVSQVNKSKG